MLYVCCMCTRVRARAWRQCGSREFACEIHSLSSPLSVGLRRRSLVCPYPPSLICGRFLTTRRPGQPTPTCAYLLRGLARGLLRIWRSVYVRTSPLGDVFVRDCANSSTKLFAYFRVVHITRYTCTYTITVIAVCSRLDVNVNISHHFQIQLKL